MRTPARAEVDLAGSERAGSSGAVGVQFEEAKAINKSPPIGAEARGAGR